MKNLDIRTFVADNGIKYTQIATELGISPEWLSRLMRYSLSPENKRRIVNAVERLQKQEAKKCIL